MSIEERILEEIGKANAENRNINAADLLKLKICSNVTLYRKIDHMIADGLIITHTVQLKHGTTRLLYLKSERESDAEIIIRQNDIIIQQNKELRNRLDLFINWWQNENGKNNLRCLRTRDRGRRL